MTSEANRGQRKKLTSVASKAVRGHSTCNFYKQKSIITLRPQYCKWTPRSMEAIRGQRYKLAIYHFLYFLRAFKVYESCQVSWKERGEGHDCKTLNSASEDHFSAQVFHSIYFQMTITCTTKVQLSKVHSLYAKYICRIVQWKWRPRNRVKITKKSLIFIPKQSVSIFYNFFIFFNFYCLLKQIKLILFFYIENSNLKIV